MKGGQFGPAWWPKYAKDLQARVKVVLASKGVSVVLMPVYYSFAMQADKARRDGLHGQDFSDYCRGLVSAYLEKRLEREVMEAILQQMFNVEPRDVRPKGSDGNCE